MSSSLITPYLTRHKTLTRYKKMHKTMPTLLPTSAEVSSYDHKKRVMDELKLAGVSRMGLTWPESRHLHSIIHLNEHIKGAVYGQNDDGSIMLVATDRRIIYIDKKPFFTTEDEVTYDVVSGVSYSHALFNATVTLHTRIKDFVVRTYNLKCADRFVHFIESYRLEG